MDLEGVERHADAQPASSAADWGPRCVALGESQVRAVRDVKTLLITEEDYIDTDEVPPGGCRGQGKFETWDLSRLNKGAITPLDTWETE
ncbi:MAG TPA: hypothetical protein VFV62_02425, partial [Gaiellaceae bacterium]|nr:hypothetical protein [Gaiellaceae bacterium]